MATPPIYDGSMATCEGFINSCRLYMSVKPQEFPTLRIKITWVLGFMQTGMAQMFRDHFLVYMATPEFQTQYEQSNKPDQIELLYCDIYKAFRDPNKQATAIQEITTIKQGSKSAEEHVQLFKQSYMRSGYGKMAGIHEFKWSLNSPLLDKCMAVPELPVTIEKWYLQRTTQQGQTRPNNLQQGVNQHAQRNWQPPVNRPQQTSWRPPVQPAVQPAQRDPNAMQVDRNRGPIRCYNCGQTGHMARVCPNPRQQQTRLVSTWNSGTNEERDELWRLMMSGGEQSGGGSTARIEEVPQQQPVTAQGAQTALHTQNFPFGQ
ncbi:hypothetical protein AMATHDRAFT_159420 [Amanita thiersii Skay4041]|uniref:CCHC-type domain-containing protein n=1 Tax=Amanita thiersii Skay4041 TaxID=703135 RepID=A0A2A9N6C9_9AGAR|nr:hypothetical protein AMATHDRAFT_159420 [Amanita thiersii Skay4041]